MFKVEKHLKLNIKDYEFKEGNTLVVCEWQVLTQTFGLSIPLSVSLTSEDRRTADGGEAVATHEHHTVAILEAAAHDHRGAGVSLWGSTAGH